MYVNFLENKKKSITKKCNKKYDTHNILELNKTILTLLEEEYNSIPELNKKKDQLQWIINNSDSDTEIQLAEKEFKNLSSKIDLIKSGFREAKYIHKTENLLKEYNSILEQPVKVDFMNNYISDKEDRKQIILMEYLNIAKDYISVKPLEGQVKSMKCEQCFIELQKVEDFLYVCPVCGYSIKHFASIASYGENNRINISQRYVYDKRSHFGDSIKKYQGKQNTTIGPQVYTDLWNKLRSHDIPIERFTKDHLYEFLKLTKHTDHYEDITLIYYEMTGISPPDISHLEQQLFSFFDQIEPIYERVKSPDRTNFLNGQFVLFKLLQKLRYPCKEEDFYILKTRDKMLEHDQIWKKICCELSWTFISTV